MATLPNERIQALDVLRGFAQVRLFADQRDNHLTLRALVLVFRPDR